MKAIQVLLALGIGIGTKTIALAQDVIILGVVRTAEGEPVRAARVCVPSLAAPIITDSTGTFQFSATGAPTPDRTLRLNVERIGFAPLE